MATAPTPTLNPPRLPRVHYAWVMVAVTFVVLITAAGVRSVPSVLIVPLEREFGWSRATVSLAVSINLLLYGALGPFAASLMERVGMRRMMVGALLMLAFAVAITTRMSAPWQLLLFWGGFVGLGAGAMTGWLSATVANRWFVSRRGLVVGALTAAGATGQLIFLPLLASVVETAGWRTAVVIVAVCTALVVPLVALVIRESPRSIGLLPYGATSATDLPNPPARSANPFRDAVQTLTSAARNRDFQLIALSFFICGASTNGLIGTHLVPMSIDHGLSEVTAASLLALIGVFDIVGTMGSGWLSDRYDNRKLLFWYYSLRGVSLLFLPFAFQSGVPGLALFVVFYGLDWVATIPPTVRLAADHFGAERVGTVFAWMLASHQLGASVAASAAGMIRTSSGDYRAAFLSAGALCLVAGLLVLQVSPTSRATTNVAATPVPSRSSRLRIPLFSAGALAVLLLALAITRPPQVEAAVSAALAWCGVR